MTNKKNNKNQIKPDDFKKLNYRLEELQLSTIRLFVFATFVIVTLCVMSLIIYNNPNVIDFGDEQ